MRKLVVLVALVMTALTAAAAFAAVNLAGYGNPEGQFAFGVSGGLVEPHGALGNEPDWSGTLHSRGLDLRYGWNGSAHADFFMTSFLSAGLWAGRSELRMRDQVVSGAPAGAALHGLVRGTTSLVGLRVKGWMPGQRSWAPYAFVGVARAFRKLDFSSGMAEVVPQADETTVRDDRVGFDGGLGVVQPLGRGFGIDANATYFYSGALEHDLAWRGGDMRLSSWEYWSVELGLTWHTSLRPAAELR